MIAVLTLTCCSGVTRTIASDRANTAARDPGEWGSGMIAVSTADHSFHVDTFEISELSQGDYFAVRNQIPATDLTRESAQEICDRFGKRLCKSQEWRAACLGISGRAFSYGNKYNPVNCNVSEGTLLLAGRKDECKSDVGAHDMVGNAMEWVSDDESGRVMALGGSFASGDKTDCFTTFYFPPGARSNQTGFRCCK